MNELPRLIAIVDLDYCGNLERWYELLQEIDRGGYGSRLQVQLRAKNRLVAQDQAIFEKARELFKSDTPLILNGDTRSAIQYHFDGVHWPEIEIAGESASDSELATVSASIHSDELLDVAPQKGVTQFVFASVFRSDWKTVEPQGLESLRTVAQKSAIPVYALGGVTVDKCASCIESGARGVAALSSICAAKRPRKTIDGYLNVLGDPTCPDRCS